LRPLVKRYDANRLNNCTFAFLHKKGADEMIVSAFEFLFSAPFFRLFQRLDEVNKKWQSITRDD
jgi:hypothetical protein